MGQATSEAIGRDYRIDFFRGLALIMIFINHIPGNVVGNYTNRNFGFSDSAEAFVLMAGFAAAAAYYHRFAGGYPVATSVRVARRAGLLYTCHILATTLAIALVCSALLILAKPDLAKAINMAPVINDPVRGFIGLATLGHQLSFFNILPLYIVLLLALPLIMSVHRISWRVLLAASLVLYLVAGLYRITLPSFPDRNTWFFNPLAWQLLFIVGFIWGARIRARQTIPYQPILFWLAVAYLIFGLIWVQAQFWNYFPKSDALGALWGFSKTYISPFRLLHVIALAYVIAMSPLARWLRGLKKSNPIVEMGQHALPIFCVGSLLSVFFMLARRPLGGGLLVDVASVAIGVIIMIVLARFLAWQAQSPAGQVGSVAAGGFMAGTPPVAPPPAPSIEPAAMPASR